MADQTKVQVTRYVVVRWGETIADERVNIAVAAWRDGDTRVEWRVIANWDRAEAFLGGVAGDVASVQQYLRQLMEQTPEKIASFAGKWASAVVITDARPSLRTPVEAVEAVAPRFLRGAFAPELPPRSRQHRSRARVPSDTPALRMVWGVAIQTEDAARAKNALQHLRHEGVQVYTTGKLDTGRAVIGVEGALITNGRVGLCGGVTALDEVALPEGPDDVAPQLVERVERALSEAGPMIRCGEPRWFFVAGAT